MRLSHKKKLAHKRSGAAKLWVLALRSRHLANGCVMMSTSINARHIESDRDCQAALLVVRSAAHTGSLMSKLVGAVASTFRRLREAGTAQTDIIRGRIG